MSRIPFSTLSVYMNRLPLFMQNSKFGTTTTGDLKKSLDVCDLTGEAFSTIVETDLENALLVTAQTEDGDYRLILDIDGEFEVRTSSGGGKHLYFGTRMTKDQHDAIVKALRDAGIVQKSWANSALESSLGATLRPPWVLKGRDKTIRQQVLW